jgi:hypothetical protein
VANFSDAIEPMQDTGGAVSFPESYFLEGAGQTFLYGTPVEIGATSDSKTGVIVWDGTTVVKGIAGFAAQAAQNYATTGAGAPNAFSPITGPGSIVGNYAANPYQPLAVITPSMTPISDGFSYFFNAGPTTVFVGCIGTSSAGTGSSVAAVATAQSQVGTAAGLTLDTNGFWFVDTNKSNAVQIIGLDPRQPVGTVGGHVLFTVINTVIQIPS